jgi:hypothetical protein
VGPLKTIGELKLSRLRTTQPHKIAVDMLMGGKCLIASPSSMSAARRGENAQKMLKIIAFPNCQPAPQRGWRSMLRMSDTDGAERADLHWRRLKACL